MLELSPFQPVERDFAFVVDRAVKAADIVRAAQSVDRKLIAGVSVFDVYEGKGIEPGKKSIAIAVTMQPREKTMTDEEIDALGRQDRRRGAQAHRRRAAGVALRLSSRATNESGLPAHELRRQQIRIGKAVALDRLADADRDLARQHRPGRHEGVEFAVLAARIDARRQVARAASASKRRPAKSAGNFFRSTHGQMRLDAAVDHLARQAPRSACATAETPA